MKSYKRSQVISIFVNIADSYDLINFVLSLGLHRHWRRFLRRRLEQKFSTEPPGGRILDVATGTGELALELAFPRLGAIDEIIALDLVEEMLAKAREKHRKLLLRKKNGVSGMVPITWVRADLMDFSEEAGSRGSRGSRGFRGITVAFGVRNFAELKQGLDKMFGLLEPGGWIFILEFSVEAVENRAIKRLLGIYLKWILPMIGGLLSGDFKAYRYLRDSVGTFPGGKRMADILEQSGFCKVEIYPLCFGVVSLYVASRS